MNGFRRWVLGGLFVVTATVTALAQSSLPTDDYVVPPQNNWYEGADTNPPDLQKWFGDLTNYMGGACCGEADGYPAVVDKVPLHDGEEGHGYVTDGSRKDIYAHGHFIKTRPEITGSKEFTFTLNQRTLEKWGNPLDHAIAFLHVEHGEITKTEAFPNGVYCVVVLLPGV